MGGDLSFGDALRWLDGHINLERNSHAEFPLPSLAKMHEVLRMMGEPHRSYPVIHVTGTNGKGSTSRMITALLMAHGLRVGTYVSPHLTRINERILFGLEQISDDDFSSELQRLKLIEEQSGNILSWFELITAASFSHFDAIGVDVAVIEVGMGGVWDATNVIVGDVAVVTNVALDHADVLGPELSDIAREKSGIIKHDSAAVLGVDQEDLLEIFLARPSRSVTVLGKDLQLRSNVQAIGGRVVSVRSSRATYDQIFMPLHGAHQGQNAALAIGAAEEFFGRALDQDVVRAAFERVTSPGRMEIVSRSPLAILDAAHNPAGMAAAKASILSDFSSIARWHLVVSMLSGRDPMQMFLAIKNDKIASVSISETRSFRAMPVQEILNGAEAAGIPCQRFETVTDALDAAIQLCREGEAVLICGSIYTVAEAREQLLTKKNLGAS